MKRMYRGCLAVAATLLAIVGIAVSSGSAQAASGTVHGCPRGAVCIYPQNKGWNGGHPESGGVFYSYGPHNLSGQHGNHYVLNNQTDTYPNMSLAAGCTGYNGTGKQSSYKFLLFPWITATPHYRTTAGERGYSWDSLNLSPVNSVVLTSPSGRDWCADV
ncbi:hypothetical protein GCM10011575_47730 [Microlunatus endophyticus]|uniref:Peptidase inhibitor family I36 n=1 Tax=Microlunatus endophyticus TaxID=1716077 RepID=A0A917WAB9_9ACTN|nr:hypothetical protein [Microlunatus endophyticus]GGL83908.1 hypothetical protein GCM10011575_47730 [Microlunatus endophyticus]